MQRVSARPPPERCDQAFAQATHNLGTTAALVTTTVAAHGLLRNFFSRRIGTRSTDACAGARDAPGGTTPVVPVLMKPMRRAWRATGSRESG